MRRQKTLRERIETRIARKRGEDVFLPREFADLGGEDQVLRALRSLTREGRLVRLGYGVYARAITSKLSGRPVLYSANGFISAARQALNKLGVKWEPTEAERAYNEGRSTQVPANGSRDASRTGRTHSYWCGSRGIEPAHTNVSGLSRALAI
jgi:hypothetical protein